MCGYTQRNSQKIEKKYVLTNMVFKENELIINGVNSTNI